VNYNSEWRKKMKEVVIIDGIRTPYTKAGTLFNNIPAHELGRIVVRELIERTNLDVNIINEVIIGNIAQPVEATNIARIIALNAGIPEKIPAFSVQRNCASGMQSVADAYYRIASGDADVIIAGGVESMSNIPLIYPKSYADRMADVFRAKTLGQRLSAFAKFRPEHFKPVIALEVGLTDGYCGLNMGQTAEVLAKENKISREEQDSFALMSHQRATKSTDSVILKQEIVPVPIPPDYKTIVYEDNGIRKNQTLEALSKLKPYFDRRNGTVTAGNSSQITDGAVALLVMSKDKAKELGYEPLGFIRSFAFAGLDPERMGLGPAMSTPIALARAGGNGLLDKMPFNVKLGKLTLRDIQLIEINEAFAAQVIANEIAFKNKEFAKHYFGMDEPIGEINREILNVNGGAIALGHPVGSSGARLILTLLKEMKRRNLELGLATLCIGGGQGGAMVLERK
jgi:acetyl-CoA acetyltransferase family protein